MAYRLKPDRPLAAELIRLVTKQLKRAAGDLTAAGARLERDHVHAARKRVKKARALLRLAAPYLPKRTFRKSNTHLQRVSRRLGGISDASAVIGTFDRLARGQPRQFHRATTRILRHALEQRHAATRRTARKKCISAKCEHLLLSEAKRAKKWPLKTKDVTSLLPTLETSQQRAGKAMTVAWRHPDPDRFHLWRRRVKSQWLQLRVVEAGAHARLRKRARELERLDGVLGEYQDLALLRRAVERTDTIMREQAAAILRVISRELRTLRRRAKPLGQAIYGEAAT